MPSSPNGGGLLSSSAPAAEKPRLLDQVREAIRTRHFSPGTEQS